MVSSRACECAVQKGKIDLVEDCYEDDTVEEFGCMKGTLLARPLCKVKPFCRCFMKGKYC